MSVKTDGQYIAHILKSVQKIGKYLSGMSYEDFASDDKTQDAVIRRLEVLSEAAGRISEVLKSKDCDVPWGGLQELRQLVQGDFELDPDVLWRKAVNDMVGLDQVLAHLSHENLKRAIVEFAEGAAKTKFYFKDLEKGVHSIIPQASARDIKRAASELVREGTLVYFSTGSTTMYGLWGRGITGEPG